MQATNVQAKRQVSNSAQCASLCSLKCWQMAKHLVYVIIKNHKKYLVGRNLEKFCYEIKITQVHVNFEKYCFTLEKDCQENNSNGCFCDVMTLIINYKRFTSMHGRFVNDCACFCTIHVANLDSPC